jgi:hypothetical protein
MSASEVTVVGRGTVGNDSFDARTEVAGPLVGMKVHSGVTSYPMKARVRN